MIRIESGLPAADLPAMREIFFATSSRKTFAAEAERDAFFERYTGYYLREEPDSLFTARDESGVLLGYLTGCKDTSVTTQPMNELWGDMFTRFPAHLHINCRPGSQGLGIGTMLITHFCRILREEGVTGVHIITSEDADNKKFYSKNGFAYELIRLWKDKPLLLMGRDL